MSFHRRYDREPYCEYAGARMDGVGIKNSRGTSAVWLTGPVLVSVCEAH